MANIDFIRGQLSKIDERPVNDGNILLATNTGQLFIDAGGSRISISSVVVVDTLPESTQAKQDVLYYAKNTNYLHHYNGNNFDIVNIPSTGEVGQVLKKTLDGIEFGLAEHIAEKQTQKPISFQVTGIDGEDFTIEFTEESGSDTPVNADMLGGKPASDYVTKNITINEKPLSGDITLNANDVGARADDWMPTATDVGADPVGSAASALSDAKAYADELTATDVGAIPKVNGSAGQFLGFISPNVVGAVDVPSGGAGKRVCRFVIGTSTSGWTEDDCDYLCDGTSDQVEINAAIQALPSGGGEIVILDGTYNIKATIAMNKDNVKLSGNGDATVLKRIWDSFTDEGVVTITAVNGGCCVENIFVDGNKSAYSSYNNYGICLLGSSDNTVASNTCNNNNNGICLSSSSNNNTVASNTCNNNNYGICLLGSSDNTVASNTCNNNNNSGIYLLSSSSNNTVTGNTCNNNNNNGIYLYSSSNNNTVASNTCNNNSSGIYLSNSSNNTVTGNTCNNNNNGIYLSNLNNNNTITGNTCIRGGGASSDYKSSQYTIRLYSTNNNYNLISSNNIMGKNYVSGGGTGNTFVNNKYN